jgi:glycosyltransferase involved in cell wall biosynthesis
MKPRHSVIIITYNQENLIGRALDSLLCQKELIYEIIVADDCSPDQTWAIIKSYQTKYPDLIKPYQNQKNLGIFGNVESTWTKADGDVIWYLAGDDIYCNGLFEEANKLIEKHQISLTDEAFTLYFDYKSINPNGKETIFRNKLVEKYNPVSLKIRQLICNRTIGIGRNVYLQFYPVRKDIGIMTDGLQDIQVQFFSKKNYYSRFIGSAYYTNIGISSITKWEISLKSYIASLEQLKKDINPLQKEDLEWLNYLQFQLSYKIDFSLKSFKPYAKSFTKIIRYFYGWSFLKREIIFMIKNIVKLILFRKKRIA